jgi:hypothetical protein
VSVTDPKVNSEEEITDVVYNWSSADPCDPAGNSHSSSATVTVTKTSPGDYSSSVSCTVTWTVHDKSANTDRSVSAGGSASCTIHMGVKWAKGGWDGGVMTAPQDKTGSSPKPKHVYALASGAAACSVSDPKPYDTWSFAGKSGNDQSGTVTYEWSCGGGWFSSTTNPDGSVVAVTTSTAASPSFTAQPNAGGGSVSCKIHDTPPVMGPYDGGSRGPTDLTAGADIAIIKPVVTVDASGPKGGYVFNKYVSKNSASISGAADLRQVFTWKLVQSWWSAKGIVGTFGGGSADITFSNTSPNGSTVDQSTKCMVPGHYIAAVEAAATLYDDDDNISFGPYSGIDYEGGTQEDISGPPAVTPNSSRASSPAVDSLVASADQAEPVQKAGWVIKPDRIDLTASPAVVAVGGTISGTALAMGFDSDGNSIPMNGTSVPVSFNGRTTTADSATGRYSFNALASDIGDNRKVSASAGDAFKNPKPIPIEVVGLSKLTVAGATVTIPDKASFVTVSATGKFVTVSAVLKPSVSAASLPDGSVTWTGGQAGSDQLTRLVPCQAGMTRVTASCGTQSVSIKVYVVDSIAKPGEYSFKLTKASAVDPGSGFGLTVFQGLRCNYVAYLQGASWHIHVNEIDESYLQGVHAPNGQKNITGPTDAKITPVTRTAVIADLTPPPAGSKFGPPRQHYWVKSITQSHEDWHVKDWKNNYMAPQAKKFASSFEKNKNNVVNFDPDDPTTQTANAVAARMQTSLGSGLGDVFKTVDHDCTPEAEKRCYDATNPEYTTLINGIK